MDKSDEEKTQNRRLLVLIMVRMNFETLLSMAVLIILLGLLRLLEFMEYFWLRFTPVVWGVWQGFYVICSGMFCYTSNLFLGFSKLLFLNIHKNFNL